MATTLSVATLVWPQAPAPGVNRVALPVPLVAPLLVLEPEPLLLLEPLAGVVAPFVGAAEPLAGVAAPLAGAVGPSGTALGLLG